LPHGEDNEHSRHNFQRTSQNDTIAFLWQHR